MKKLKSLLILSLMVALALAVLFSSRGVAAAAYGAAVWDGTVTESFAGGTGTEKDPFQISNGAELAFLADRVNAGDPAYNGNTKYYILTADIELNNTANWQNWGINASGIREWAPIGTYVDDYDFSKAFQANFDGGGYKIKGIYINAASGYKGLFGAVYSNVIQNIGVEQSYIKGGNAVGGVAGIVGGAVGSVTNCYNAGIVMGTSTVGGVVGSVSGAGIVINCYNTGTVTGNEFIGGVAGGVLGSAAVNCYNTGAVTGAYGYAGGVAGGVVGGDAGGGIANCYNAGGVAGSNYNCVGGVAGYIDSVIVANCYYLTGRITINGVLQTSAQEKGIGENNGGTAADILKFNVSGNLNGEIIINETQYNNLLDALNGWRNNNAAYKQWYFIADINNWYPVFAPTLKIIYFDQSGGAFSGTHDPVNPAVRHVYGGSNTELGGAVKTDYTFIGWFADSGCTGNAVAAVGSMDYTRDITLYAKWQSNFCTVTFVLSGGKGVSGSLTVDRGDVIDISGYIPALTGYEFAGWYLDNAGTQQAGNAITVNSDMHLYSKWTKNTVSDGCALFSFNIGSSNTAVLLLGLLAMLFIRGKR